MDHPIDRLATERLRELFRSFGEQIPEDAVAFNASTMLWRASGILSFNANQQAPIMPQA